MGIGPVMGQPQNQQADETWGVQSRLVPIFGTCRDSQEPEGVPQI